MDITNNRYLKPMVTSFLVAFMVAVLGFSPSSIFSVLLIFTAVFGVIVTKLFFDKSVSKFVVFAMSVGFIIKVIYAYKYSLSSISPFPDSFGYLDRLQEFKSVNILNFFDVTHAAQTSQFSYYYLLYIVDKISSSTFAQSMANITLFYWSAYLLFKAIQKDFGSDIANRTTLLFVISMTTFLYTSNILKDSWVLFWFLLCFYLYKRNNRITIWVIAAVTVLMSARIYSGFAFLAAIYWDYLRVRWPNASFKSKFFNITIPTIGLLFALKLPLFYELKDNIKLFTLQHGYFAYFTKSVSGMFNMFFSPYPYGTIVSREVTTYSIIEIDSALMIIFFPLLFMFIRKMFISKELRKKAGIYIVPVIIHATTLGLAYDGSASRQRICVFGFMILFYVLGKYYKEEKTLN